MKKIFFTIIAIVSVMIFSSCSNDEESDFDYPLETLYGKWYGVAIKTSADEEWMDVTEYPYSEFKFGVKFNSDNTYYGYGYFGNGSGTYTTNKKRITTYVNGKKYLYYDVQLLSSTKAQATMREVNSDSTIEIKLEKR